MKKVDNFVISVGMDKKQNSVADAMARLQLAILNLFDDNDVENKKHRDVSKEFQRLKRIMYGVDDG